MEKRKMLSFDVIGQLTIKALASVFLFFCAGMLIKGIVMREETIKGAVVMAVFAALFLAGGVVGILRAVRQYRSYRRENPRKRDY